MYPVQCIHDTSVYVRYVQQVFREMRVEVIKCEVTEDYSLCIREREGKNQK